MSAAKPASLHRFVVSRRRTLGFRGLSPGEAGVLAPQPFGVLPRALWSARPRAIRLGGRPPDPAVKFVRRGGSQRGDAGGALKRVEFRPPDPDANPHPAVASRGVSQRGEVGGAPKRLGFRPPDPAANPHPAFARGGMRRRDEVGGALKRVEFRPPDPDGYPHPAVASRGVIQRGEVGGALPCAAAGRV